MTREPMWRRYLRLTRPNAGADIDDEVTFHLEQRTAELRGEGMAPEAARREALARFGDVSRYAQECVAIDRSRARHERILEWGQTTWRDVRVALRQYRRSPWFATGTVATLALGIGATLAMYGLVDAVVLRPLPGVTRANELVEITSPNLSYPGFRDLRGAVPSVMQLAGFRDRDMTLRHGDASTRLTGHVVSGNYFGVVGARAALGRVLVESDDAPVAQRVVVLSHTLWVSRFHRDTSILGSVVSVNGSPATVVGIAAPGFRGTRINAVPALWITVHGWWAAAPTYYAGLSLERRGWSWITTIARLRPGQTPTSAAAALREAALRLRQELSLSATDSFDPQIIPAVAAASGGPGGALTRSFIWVLFATVALVLLLAWVNVASLLIARGMQREREIGVRLAIGAGRKRLIRQLLTETAVLAVCAGGASLAAAYVGVRLLSAIAVPGWGEFQGLSLGIGGGTAALAVAAALGTSLLFGLTPALRATRRDVVAAITHGGFRAPRSARLRDLLLVSQVALTVVLLVSTALFARGLQRALAIDPGFDAALVAVTAVDLGMARYDESRARAYLDGASQRLAALPGVTAAAWADALPLNEGSNTESFGIVGEPRLPDDLRYVEISAVTDGYFDALRIPLRLGRVFSATDHSTRARVVVVNETFARRHRGTSGIVGRQLVLQDTFTVIGVVADVKYHRLDEQPQPFVYAPLSRFVAGAGLSPIGVLVRSDRRDPALLATVESTLRDLARDVTPFGRQWLTDHYADALLPQRLSLFLLGACSLLAFVIALVGIYSVSSFFIVSHRRELALRIALGARPQSVVGRVLGHGLRRVGIGVLAGTLAVAGAMRAAQALLYGVGSTDPPAIAAGAGLVLIAAMVASFFPARLASRMDAMRSLRQD